MKIVDNLVKDTTYSITLKLLTQNSSTTGTLLAFNQYGYCMVEI